MEEEFASSGGGGGGAMRDRQAGDSDSDQAVVPVLRSCGHIEGTALDYYSGYPDGTPIDLATV